MIKEACVGSYLEAKSAVAKGANRLELCDNLKEGGTTPSFGTIQLAQQTLNVPLAVMIRPRGGDFIYSDDEIDIMKRDIKVCRSLGVEGVVFGVLTHDHQIDVKKMTELIQCALPMKVICHMACDEVENRDWMIEQLMELGVDRVLTKGGKQHALAHLDELKRMNEQANGRIVIVAGGGVTSDNYHEIIEKTGIQEVHGTRIV